MRSLEPLDFLMVPPPDHDPCSAENGPGWLCASRTPAPKSNNPATAAAFIAQPKWGFDRIN